MTNNASAELRNQVTAWLLKYGNDFYETVGHGTIDEEVYVDEIMSLIAQHDLEVERKARVDELNKAIQVCHIHASDTNGIALRKTLTERLAQLQPAAQGDREEGKVMDTSKVTRFEVIDHRDTGDPREPVKGRVFVEYGVSIELSLQDDGRTLKVFLQKAAPGDTTDNKVKESK